MFWFLKGSSLETEDVHLACTSKQLARLLANFHALRMPFSKEPTWLFENIANYLHKIENNISSTNAADTEKFQRIKNLHLTEEFFKLRWAQFESPRLWEILSKHVFPFKQRYTACCKLTNCLLPQWFPCLEHLKTAGFQSNGHRLRL